MNSASIRQNLVLSSVPVGAWPAQSFQVVSLLDMLPFAAEVFHLQSINLRAAITTLIQTVDSRGLDAQTTEADAAKPLAIVRDLQHWCKEISLERANEHLWNLETRLTRVEHGYPLTELIHDLKNLDQAIGRDFGDKLFICLQPGEEALYQKPEVFGPDVKTKFPLANQDITIAGTCYAMNDYQGCVFHLMRAVEYGARAMLEELGVQSFDGQPVELCDWGKLHGALTAQLPSLSKGKRADSQVMSDFEWYSYPIQEFEKFRVWRNKVSHLREPFLPGQTRDIIDATERYMRHLATRLDEVGLKI